MFAIVSGTAEELVTGIDRFGSGVQQGHSRAQPCERVCRPPACGCGHPTVRGVNRPRGLLLGALGSQLLGLP
jgi:hypothetical protein